MNDARLRALVSTARSAQASDLHLEAGLPACLRVRGQLRSVGAPLEARALLEMAREVVGEEGWADFLRRRSCDAARTIDGVRCRVNVLCTSRGVGLAVRLLAGFQVTLERLNLHPSTTAEALQRVVGAFPAEIQGGICAQLADCLVAVVSQRLRYFPEHDARAPECEVLVGTQAVRAIVRQGQFYKIPTALETGGGDGCFTFPRYREWLERKAEWKRPFDDPAEAAPRSLTPAERPLPASRRPASAEPERDGVIEIPAADDDLARVLSELEGGGRSRG